jgi:hypothetical protein
MTNNNWLDKLQAGDTGIGHRLSTTDNKNLLQAYLERLEEYQTYKLY